MIWLAAALTGGPVSNVTDRLESWMRYTSRGMSSGCDRFLAIDDEQEDKRDDGWPCDESADSEA